MKKNISRTTLRGLLLLEQLTWIKIQESESKSVKLKLIEKLRSKIYDSIESEVGEDFKGLASELREIVDRSDESDDSSIEEFLSR
ncbi:MAG: hypothetical protein F4W91_11415 [Gemmatimonadetes bacterium]|nr:hypothetical protein [Gemmatimonadota bacterium]